MSINDIPKYENLLHKITNKFPAKYRQDLFQECYIEMYNILERYDDTRGTFQTFAYKRLFYHCIDYLKVNMLNHESLDEVVFEDDFYSSTKADMLEDKNNFEAELEYNEFLEKAEEKLTPQEQFIRAKYADGVSVKDIIKAFYPIHHIKSEKTIRKILKK